MYFTQQQYILHINKDIYNDSTSAIKNNIRTVSAKYCYITHELRLHQNDRCKRFTPV